MMNGLEAILRRPKTVIVIMLIMLAGGISAYINLPKESQPNVDVPYLYVSVSQSGVSPADAERLLIRPLEQELRNLEGVKTMTSTASKGHGSIFLEFDINFDKDEAIQDVREKVDSAKNSLPEGADEPTVHEISAVGFAHISVVIYGDVPERALYRTARSLKDELEGLSTVREVEMSGHREEVLDVIVDQLKLESYNLTTASLYDALAKNNLLVAAGSLDSGQGKFSVELPGLIETAADVYNLPIKADGTSIVTFGDVAELKRTFKDATQFTRLNGRPAINLGVYKRLNANTILNSEKVRELVTAEAENWPGKIEYAFMLDQSADAKSMLTSLQSSVLTAIALVMIVTIAMLGIRSALLIGLAIPVSFMTGFLFLQMTGININMMIMFGLILTVGMLVDGAIVVVEYADRKIAEGMERRDAYIRSARLMFWPIASSTGTTLAAFLPILMWPGVIGKFMSYLPIMVIIVLCASLITAMIFLPVVGGLFARKKVSAREREMAEHLSGDHFDIKRLSGIMRLYTHFLKGMFWQPVLLIIAVIFGLISIFSYFGDHNNGVEAFPVIEPEFATVAISGRGNFSPNEVRDLLIEVEERVLTVAGVEDVMFNFGSTGAVADTAPDVIGNLQLEFTDYNERRKAGLIFAEIREKVADIPGIRIEVLAAEGGPPVGKDIGLRIFAENHGDLAPTVRRIRRYLETEIGDVVDIEDGRSLPGIDWEISIDRALAAQYGIGVRELGPYIQLITSGVNIGRYRPNDAADELDIRVRLPLDQRSFDTLDDLKITTNQGAVPVSNFITRTAKRRVGQISRRDGVYTMSVRGNVTNGATGPAKIEELKEWLDTQEWPANITFEFGGADEQTQETNAFMMQAGLLAMFLMFLILLTQFNSFYQVFLTLSTVVMSVAGVLLGMLITGQAFSAIMTGIGIVALAGIVVNNSIVLIDTFNRLKAEGIEPRKASLMTAAQRMRPIMLTTITTIFGLLPMAAGVSLNFFERTIEIGGISGSWWIQLATTVISGLAFSTMLTLLVVPVLLAAPTIWSRQFVRMFRGKAGVARFDAKIEAKYGKLRRVHLAQVAQEKGAIAAAAAQDDYLAEGDYPIEAQPSPAASAANDGELVAEEIGGVTVISKAPIGQSAAE